MTLDLSNCIFSEEEEENLKSLSKNENLGKLILEGSNLSKDIQQNISQISKIMDPVKSQLKSMIQFGIEQSALFQDNKKTLLYYTTEPTYLKPEMYVSCKCSRKLTSDNIYNCFGCEETYCVYCTKSEPYCYTCFGCGKSQLIQ